MSSKFSQPNPVFVKGDLRFECDGKKFDFHNKSISVVGVTGLPWESLSPERHFGSKVQVAVNIEGPRSYSFETEGFITREHTPLDDYMGVRFFMEPSPRRFLGDLIEKHGFYPKEYLRKYPRIPVHTSIRTFPVRVLSSMTDAKHSLGKTPIIYDVRNISLGGILLSTENQLVLGIYPGTQLDIYLEPRGDFSMPITIRGRVCWSEDELNPGNGNLVRYLGIKFTYLNEENRTLYLELVRDILTRMKEIIAEDERREDAGE